MEILEKTRNILENIKLDTPIIELFYDEQKNLIGYIASNTFNNMEDEDAQKLIWNALKNNLPTEEIIKILSIFHETPQERNNRIFGNNPLKIKHSNIWMHNTKDMTKYWIFIDVSKFEDNYKTFFLTVNAKTKFKKGLTIEYPKNVIEFMELKQEEIYNELFTNVFNNAEAEIKMDLMFKHDELEKKGVYWKDNIFSYVYDNFELKPASKKDLIFSKEEIEIISKSFQGIESFKVKDIVLEAIQKSIIINKMKNDISKENLTTNKYASNGLKSQV